MAEAVNPYTEDSSKVFRSLPYYIYFFSNSINYSISIFSVTEAKRSPHYLSSPSSWLSHFYQQNIITIKPDMSGFEFSVLIGQNAFHFSIALYITGLKEENTWGHAVNQRQGGHCFFTLWLMSFLGTSCPLCFYSLNKLKKAIVCCATLLKLNFIIVILSLFKQTRASLWNTIRSSCSLWRTEAKTPMAHSSSCESGEHP